MENINLKEELIALLEKEVGFTGKYILQKQCQRLNIDPDKIDVDNLQSLSEQIHWAIRGFTGEKKANEIKEGILEYKNAIDTIRTPGTGSDDLLSTVKAQLTIGDKKFFLGLFDEAEEIFRKTIELLNKGKLKDDLDLQAKVKRHLARVLCYEKENRETAKEEYKEVVKIGKRAKNAYEVSLALCGLGNLSWRSGEHKTALKYYKDGLKALKPMTALSKKDKDRKNRAKGLILSGMGNTYLDLIEMDLSIKHNEMAIEIFRELGNFAEVGRVYNNLSRVYEEMGEYDKAIDGYESGIKFTNEAGSRRMEGWTRTNLASAYIEDGRVEDAKPQLIRASKILEIFADPVAHSKLHCMYGKYYRAKEEWDDSLTHLQKSIEFVINEKSPDYLALAQEELGALYLKMGDEENAKDQLKKALAWYEKKGETPRIEKVTEMLKILEN